MPPINPLKVQQKVNELNAVQGVGAGFWVQADGINALTSMTVDGNEVTFNPNFGIPAKVFINQQTGEIKIYDARIFT